MVDQVKRINVTVPIRQLEQIRRLVSGQPNEYPSVSAFVTEAIAARLADAEAHQLLLDALASTGGEPDKTAVDWAADALRTADEAAAAATDAPDAA